MPILSFYCLVFICYILRLGCEKYGQTLKWFWYRKGWGPLVQGTRTIFRCCSSYNSVVLYQKLGVSLAAAPYKQLSFGTKTLFLVTGCSIIAEINKTNSAVSNTVWGRGSSNTAMKTTICNTSNTLRLLNDLWSFIGFDLDLQFRPRLALQQGSIMDTMMKRSQQRLHPVKLQEE